MAVPTVHQLSPRDNVGVLIDACCSGEAVLYGAPPTAHTLLTRAPIPGGHKVALADIEPGAPIVKYGFPIGRATCPILAGDHVHLHNTAYDRSLRFDGDDAAACAHVSNRADQADTFSGFLRRDGRAGIRNIVVVMAASNCAASVVKAICRSFPADALTGLGVDRVVPVTYGHGCALAINGEGFRLLARTLAGWIDHPNVVGALLVGLGCESMDPRAITALIPHDAHVLSTGCLRAFTIQDAGGFGPSVERGVREVNELLRDAARAGAGRVPLPVSALKLALNCGGSDAFSGLTANPILGLVSDRFVSQGATAALAEIPECWGAEDFLAARCARPEDAERIRAMFRWWSDYAQAQGIELNDNLSAGNHEGGLTTILEKSLGALAKGGSARISQALGYAERLLRPGLALMDTPGYDPVSMTGLMAGGCTLGLFTTGRGSLYGCAIAPVIKIASNSRLFSHMRGDMDVNAGAVLDGMPQDAAAEVLYREVLRVASGGLTASERNGIGEEEFVPWTPKETL